MKGLSISLAALSLAVTLSPPVLHGQRFTADLRAAPAAPTQELAGADLSTGIGFGATLAFRLQPHLALYGGWDWLHFAADQSFAGADLDFEETGYDIGLRFEHPFGDETGVLYRIEGGATYKHVEIEDAEGDLIGDSGHGLGFEGAAGIVVPLGNGSWRLAPMLRYRSLSPEFEMGSSTIEGDLRYATVEIGLSRRF
jgi:hypothetical protein